MDTFLAWLYLGVCIVVVIGALPVHSYLKRRRKDKYALDQQAAYETWRMQYEAWKQPLDREATSLQTPPERLRELAAAPLPSEPAYRFGYLEILRLVATNPSTPAEIQGGLISRIGSEESAMRIDGHFQQLQQQLRRMESGRGGGMIAGGGVSLPID